MCVRKISGEKKGLTFFLHLKKIRSNTIGSIFCKVKRSDGKGAWGFALQKMSIQRGLGHWKIAPTKNCEAPYACGFTPA
jgi:hypothetical protein